MLSSALAVALLAPASAGAIPYGAGTYGGGSFNVGEQAADATTESESSSSSSGWTVQGQVKNLIKMGKVDQANTLMRQYPNLFPTGTTTAVATATSTQPSGARYVFTRSLQYLDRGEDVRQLQIYLNTHGALLAADGPGSPGQATDFFGALTYRALVRLQEMHADQILVPIGLTKGTGFFGPATLTFVRADTP